jgi:hypothetical protein
MARLVGDCPVAPAGDPVMWLRLADDGCTFCGDPPVHTAVAHTHDVAEDCPGDCGRIHVCDRCADLVVRKAADRGLTVRDRRTE